MKSPLPFHGVSPRFYRQNRPHTFLRSHRDLRSPAPPPCRSIAQRGKRGLTISSIAQDAGGATRDPVGRQYGTGGEKAIAAVSLSPPINRLLTRRSGPCSRMLKN